MINILWVVEILTDGWWYPTIFVGITRDDARDKIYSVKRNNPNDKFRIKKYWAGR